MTPVAENAEPHTFEILHLRRIGEHYDVEIAVDGRRNLPFIEPACNVEGMSEDEFLAYLREQALGMHDYCRSQEATR